MSRQASCRKLFAEILELKVGISYDIVNKTKMHPKNPQNKRYFSVSELAKALEMTVQGIHGAVHNGNLVKTAAGLDLSNEINQYYIRRVQGKKSLPVVPLYEDDSQEGKKKVKLVKSKDGKVKIKKLIKKQRTKKFEEKHKKLLKDEKRSRKESEFAEANFEASKTKHEAELARINAQTTKYNVKIAEDMKVLISRKLVDKMFGQLYSISQNQFLILGDRLAPLVAGMCGSTDAEVILKVKKKIEDEVTRILRQVKELTEQEL